MPASDLDRFKQKVRRAHAREFELHRSVAVLAERLIIAQPRAHPDSTALVLDMLIVQAYKAHLSTEILGEHGHLEDMATMVRRLLELGMQSVYIGGDSEGDVREQRAAQFIAFLWDSLPEHQKAKLPAELQRDWEERSAPASNRRPDRTKWGPRFDQMFEYAERTDTYREDYRLLSALAHGSSPSLINQYSLSPIPVHSVKQIGALLIYASRYYLGVLDHWIRLYNEALYVQFEPVQKQLQDWSSTDDIS